MSLKTNYRDGDSFTKKSKQDGYRSRASYKLKEILEKERNANGETNIHRGAVELLVVPEFG